MIALFIISVLNLACLFFCISFYIFTCKVRNSVVDYINRQINVVHDVYNKTLSLQNNKPNE